MRTYSDDEIKRALIEVEKNEKISDEEVLSFCAYRGWVGGIDIQKNAYNELISTRLAIGLFLTDRGKIQLSSL